MVETEKAMELVEVGAIVCSVAILAACIIEAKSPEERNHLAQCLCSVVEGLRMRSVNPSMGYGYNQQQDPYY